MPKVCNKNEGERGAGVKLVTIKRKNEFTSQLPFCSLGYIHQTVTHPVQYICKGESQVAKVSKSSKLIQSSVKRERMQDIFEETTKQCHSGKFSSFKFCRILSKKFPTFNSYRFENIKKQPLVIIISAWLFQSCHENHDVKGDLT